MHVRWIHKGSFNNYPSKYFSLKTLSFLETRTKKALEIFARQNI